jgi:hypothetical protein
VPAPTPKTTRTNHKMPRPMRIMSHIAKTKAATPRRTQSKVSMLPPNRRKAHFSPWIAIATAHVMTEAAISTRNGTTGDFADFAIAISRHARVGNLTGLSRLRRGRSLPLM